MFFMDYFIYVCKFGDDKFIKAFNGYIDEVNVIKWDLSGMFFVFCLDDFMVKVWSLKKDMCVYDFNEYEKEIYIIKWSFTGFGTENFDFSFFFVIASYDVIIKFWDVEFGKCLYMLEGYIDLVYFVVFSFDGKYFVSGFFDKYLYIWNVKDGSLMRTY